MEQMERETAPSIEDASRELRLIEQSIFRDMLQGARDRCRQLLTWTVVGFIGVGVVWTFLTCPVLHHRIGWCPMEHASAR